MHALLVALRCTLSRPHEIGFGRKKVFGLPVQGTRQDIYKGTPLHQVADSGDCPFANGASGFRNPWHKESEEASPDDQDVDDIGLPFMACLRTVPRLLHRISHFDFGTHLNVGGHCNLEIRPNSKHDKAHRVLLPPQPFQTAVKPEVRRSHSSCRASADVSISTRQHLTVGTGPSVLKFGRPQ
jgi:hypothetical protein